MVEFATLDSLPRDRYRPSFLTSSALGGRPVYFPDARHKLVGKQNSYIWNMASDCLAPLMMSRFNVFRTLELGVASDHANRLNNQHVYYILIV